jgi:Cu-Zn family superoxide dismutase
MIAACATGARDASDTGTADTAAATSAAGTPVTTTVRDASGRDLGTLTLADSSGGISMSGTLMGLAPGEHAMHVHTIGRCEPPSFESAGSHWNPTNRQHGSQNAEGPHLGDLPNVTVGADSQAVVRAVTPGGSLRGAPEMLLDADGAAVIIHAASDDYRTDPSGNSGDRAACGVVTGT